MKQQNGTASNQAERRNNFILKIQNGIIMKDQEERGVNGSINFFVTK